MEIEKVRKIKLHIFGAYLRQNRLLPCTNNKDFKFIPFEFYLNGNPERM